MLDLFCQYSVFLLFIVFIYLFHLFIYLFNFLNFAGNAQILARVSGFVQLIPPTSPLSSALLLHPSLFSFFLLLLLCSLLFLFLPGSLFLPLRLPFLLTLH